MARNFLFGTSLTLWYFIKGPFYEHLFPKGIFLYDISKLVNFLKSILFVEDYFTLETI